MNKSKATTGGFSLLSVVFIVFLTLKLAELGAMASWSWWWVTAPLWAPVAILLLVVIVIILVQVFISLKKRR